MNYLFAMALIALIASPVAAQTAADDASGSVLELDLRPDPDEVAASSESERDVDAAPPSAAMVNDMLGSGDSQAGDDAVLPARYSVDTPILVLVSDPRAKAVLDKDMPGLTSDENYPKFKRMSLRQLQPQTGGQLTDELLDKVQNDLQAIGGEKRDTAAKEVGR